MPCGPSSGARKSGSGVASRPSAVAVTRLARRGRADHRRAGPRDRPRGRRAGRTWARLLVRPDMPGALAHVGIASSVARSTRASCACVGHRPRPGPGHAADRRGHQGPDRLRPARARRPAALHPALAAEWGVSRTTVTARLRAAHRGGVSGDAARAPGRAVAQGLGLSAPPARPAARGRRPAACRPSGERLAGFALPAVARGRRAGRRGLPLRRPVGRGFPGAGLEEGGDRLHAAPPGAPPLRAIPAARPALRAALQGYLWRARGLRCDAGRDHRGERLAAGARPLRAAAARSRATGP